MRSTKPLPRKVHISDLVWSYKIGSSMVVVRDPSNTKTIKVNHSEFTGLPWDCLERLGWKNHGYQITPQDIKDFIENDLKPVKYEDQLYRFAVSKVRRRSEKV